MKIFIFLSMLFAHVFDDYVLQGCLANLKQKDWWKKLPNYNNKYSHDYIAALICHSISWTFMIMLPLAVAQKFELGWLFIAYPINIIIHAITDNYKANKFKINLIQDQLIHLTQICLTFLAYLLIFIER